jgi:hypothetical protein
MNERVYLHETIDIIGQNRAAYNHHMTANYGHIAREERRLLCVGVFSTVGSTERWPQSTNIWEFEDGWPGVARNFRHEFSNTEHQDKNLVPWWKEAAGYRSGGYDRLLVPAPWSPTLQQLLDDGVRGECYYHEQVSLEPGPLVASSSWCTTTALPSPNVRLATWCSRLARRWCTTARRSWCGRCPPGRTGPAGRRPRWTTPPWPTGAAR